MKFHKYANHLKTGRKLKNWTKKQSIIFIFQTFFYFSLEKKWLSYKRKVLSFILSLQSWNSSFKNCFKKKNLSQNDLEMW